MLAQSADSGQSEYNSKEAELTGGTYLALNASVVWRGFEFRANGPYECAFALHKDGKEVSAHTLEAPGRRKYSESSTGERLLYLCGTNARDDAGR